MRGRVEPAHLLATGVIVSEALAPFVDADWSQQAGPLEWDVARTIAHMIAAPAKYTLYLASGSPTFIALSCGAWPDATHAEVHASIRPVTEGLAAVARWVPADAHAYHATGLTDAEGFLALACVELLVHCDDVLRGFGARLSPPEDLASAVMAVRFPGAVATDGAWRALIAATGRPTPDRN